MLHQLAVKQGSFKKIYGSKHLDFFDVASLVDESRNGRVVGVAGQQQVHAFSVSFFRHQVRLVGYIRQMVAVQRRGFWARVPEFVAVCWFYVVKAVEHAVNLVDARGVRHSH